MFKIKNRELQIKLEIEINNHQHYIPPQHKVVRCILILEVSNTKHNILKEYEKYSNSLDKVKWLSGLTTTLIQIL